MGPRSVQNSSLSPHLLVGVAAPARLALHTHRDPGKKEEVRREERRRVKKVERGERKQGGRGGQGRRRNGNCVRERVCEVANQ